MSIIRSTGVIVMLLAFVLAIGVSADTVIVRNKFENNKAVITVACYANVDWSSEQYVKPGEEVAATVPFNNERQFGGRPSWCTGFWKYAGLPGQVKIYRSFLNHEACKDKCLVEVRDNGSFLWNQTEKAWDLIDKLPHHHAAVSGHHDYFLNELLMNDDGQNDQMPSTLQQHWLPPPLGTIKINVDGATRDGLFAAAVVARSHTGEVIFCASSVGNVCLNSRDAAEVAEANAMLLGLQVAINLRLDNVLIESDASNIVQAVNDRHFAGAWRIRSIMEEIRETKSRLSLCVVSKVHRNANKAAHTLAQEAANHRIVQNWTDGSFPSCITSVIENDRLL